MSEEYEEDCPECGFNQNKHYKVPKEDLEVLIRYAEYKADEQEEGSKYDYNWWLKCQERYLTDE